MAALTVLDAALQGQNPLLFTQPVVRPEAQDRLRYNVGQQVNVSWTTPYNHTTLEVWQGPATDGSYMRQTLAANWTQDESMLMWEVRPINGADLNADFYFRLQKGHQPNTCDECVASSPTFRVRDPNGLVASSSTSTSASSTSMATSTTATTTAAVAPAVTTSAAPASSQNGLSEGAKLGIGLGVGLGVGLLLIILALLLLLLLRKRRRERRRTDDLARNAEIRENLRVSGAESWLTGMTGDSKKTESYHEPFDFEGPVGYVKEGSERLWLDPVRRKPLPQ